jgi:hypothetical protein
VGLIPRSGTFYRSCEGRFPVISGNEIAPFQAIDIDLYAVNNLENEIGFEPTSVELCTSDSERLRRKNEKAQVMFILEYDDILGNTYYEMKTILFYGPNRTDKSGR